MLAILTYGILKLGTAARLFSSRYTLVTFVSNAAGLREEELRLHHRAGLQHHLRREHADLSVAR